MYKVFVTLGAYGLLILSLILFVPFHVGRIIWRKIRNYLSDVSYKADNIIEDWGHFDEE